MSDPHLPFRAEQSLPIAAIEFVQLQVTKLPGMLIHTAGSGS